MCRDAVRIGEIIREAFKDYDIEFEFTYMNLMDKQDGDAKIRDRIGIIPRAVVGTVDLGLKGIPYISVEDLVTGYGMANLEQLLFENVRHEKEGIQADHDAVMETALGRVLSFLAPEKMCRCRLPRYLTKPRQRRNEWDMAGSDGISRVSAVLEENRY